MAFGLLIIIVVKIQSLIRQLVILVTLKPTLVIESHFLGLIYLCLVPVKEIVSRGNCLLAEITGASPAEDVINHNGIPSFLRL